jgi:hypothetical protein
VDFHAEFQKSLDQFPGLEGLIFVDPDGESILFEAPSIDPFDVQLTGARLPILQQHFQFVGLTKTPVFMELQFQKRYMISVCLKQNYSITAIGRSPKERGHLKFHLWDLARKFNQEII